MKDPTARLPAPLPCRACKQPMLDVDRYCPACGADHRWIRRARPLLRRIPRMLDVAQFQEEGDRMGSSALALAAPVQAVVRYYLRRIAEPEYRHQLLGSAMKVSGTQFPRVHRLARFCEKVLHTAPVEVYVATAADAGTFAFGAGSTDVVVIPATTVDSLDDDELVFVLGGQLGHVKADHVLYLTVAKALGTALKGIPALGGALSSMAAYLLIPWERQATLTADRAGLLCCQDLPAASSALLKLSVGAGATMATLNLEEFLAQARSLEDKQDWGDSWKNTPALLRRLRELETFYDSSAWDHVFEGAWDPAAPRFRCFYCPGGATPQSGSAVLSGLACSSCRRNLMIEEIPCPHCMALMAVHERATLGNLICETCGKAYLSGGALRALAAPPDCTAIRELSAYQRLRVHPTASPTEIRSAFRERISPLQDSVAGLDGSDPVREKIRLYASYTTLLDPARRADHDAALERAQELAARAPDDPTLRALARCPACQAPVSGAWCGLCGVATRPPAGTEATGLPAELLAELRGLAAQDVGELVEDPCGVFDFAFHYRRRSLFFKRTAQLSRPSAIRGLLRAAADIAAAQGFSSSPEFFAVLDRDDLDRELLLKVVHEKPARPGDRSQRIGALVPQAAGAGLLLLAPERKAVRSEAYASCREWLSRALGITIEEPPSPPR